MFWEEAIVHIVDRDRTGLIGGRTWKKPGNWDTYLRKKWEKTQLGNS